MVPDPEHGNEMSSEARSAIWEHYYMKDDEIKSIPRRRLRRVTKKEIIVRTLKDQRSGEGILSLQELSGLTGMSAHDLSGHLTHLVNEGKVVRRGRGLFALAIPVREGRSHREELRDLVKSVAASRGHKAGNELEQKVTFSEKDYSEGRRMMLDFLSDALMACGNVELTIKCTKDEKGKGGKTVIELKAH